MIVMDTPRTAVFRGKKIRTAHIMSTLHHAEGTRELVDFCVRLGMKPAWLQHAGAHSEHFDLMGRRCDDAQRAGAVVDYHLLGETLIAKRKAYYPKPRPRRVLSTECKEMADLARAFEEGS